MKTTEEIYREMMDCFARETGMEPDGTGELAVRMYALAAQVYGLYQEAEWTRRQCFPQTATGEDLDKHAFLRGLARQEARPAEGTLQFLVSGPASQDLTIPQGTVAMTAGLVSFETTQAGVLKAGTNAVEVPARAVRPGAAGNVPAGTVRTMAVAPVGVDGCTNPAAFVGGCGEEGDEALRTRILASYRRLPNGTNAAYYAQEALAVDGVTAVTVLPRNRGLGTVDLYVTGPSGLPSADLLAAVREDLQTKREIGVDLQVLAPAGVKTDVLVTVKVREGMDGVAVRSAVAAALETFFDGTLLGKDLLLARLGQVVYQVDGVENYKFYAPANDLAVAAGQLPVLGTLAVEEMP